MLSLILPIRHSFIDNRTFWRTTWIIESTLSKGNNLKIINKSNSRPWMTNSFSLNFKQVTFNFFTFKNQPTKLLLQFIFHISLDILLLLLILFSFSLLFLWGSINLSAAFFNLICVYIAVILFLHPLDCSLTFLQFIKLKRSLNWRFSFVCNDRLLLRRCLNNFTCFCVHISITFI